jgi:hypothetical protein
MQIRNSTSHPRSRRRVEIRNIIHTILRKLAKSFAEKEAKTPSVAELNDHSYQNAIIDARVRSFFQAEYKNKEPSSSALPHLMRAIQLHQQQQNRRVQASITPQLRNRLAMLLSKATEGFQHARPSSALNRLMSTGLVMLLLLFAAGPNATHLLRGLARTSDTQSSYQLAPQSPAEPQNTFSRGLPDAKQRLLEQKLDESFGESYSRQEVRPLDPPEMGLFDKKTSSTQVEPVRQPHSNWPE